MFHPFCFSFFLKKGIAKNSVLIALVKTTAGIYSIFNSGL